MLQPNLGGLVSYLSAPTGRKGAAAKRLSEQGETDYAVETDFWKKMREAIVRDRKTTRDGRALLIAVDAAGEKKRPSFKAVADSWPSLAMRWRATTYCSPRTTVVSVGGLQVSVRPLFLEQDAAGDVESVSVWMNLQEPTESAVLGALRFMTLASPAGSATFVDARRAKIWSGGADALLEVDSWLERECARLLSEAA